MEGRYLKNRNEKLEKTLEEIKVCANKCLGFYPINERKPLPLGKG